MDSSRLIKIMSSIGTNTGIGSKGNEGRLWVSNQIESSVYIMPITFGNGDQYSSMAELKASTIVVSITRTDRNLLAKHVTIPLTRFSSQLRGFKRKEILEAASVAGWLAFVGESILVEKTRKSDLVFAQHSSGRGGLRTSSPNNVVAPVRSGFTFVGSAQSKSGQQSEAKQPSTEPDEGSPTDQERQRPRPGSGYSGGEPRRTAPKALHKGPCGTIQDPKAEAMIFPHDYDCSKVASSAVLGICAPVEVNFISCCQDHDIGLWCSDGVFNVLDATAEQVWLSQKLFACILEKFATAYAEQTPWYCMIIDGLIGLIEAFVTAIFYDVVTALFGVGSYAWNGPTENFPGDGRNRNSCLCGGSEPTVWKENQCENLCARHGKPQNCFKCHMRCISENGKFVRREFVTDPQGKPCCPGTDRQCTKDCDETDVTKCKRGGSGSIIGAR